MNFEFLCIVLFQVNRRRKHAAEWSDASVGKGHLVPTKRELEKEDSVVLLCRCRSHSNLIINDEGGRDMLGTYTEKVIHLMLASIINSDALLRLFLD